MTRARRTTLLCAALVAAMAPLGVGCDAILGIERAEQDPSSSGVGGHGGATGSAAGGHGGASATSSSHGSTTSSTGASSTNASSSGASTTSASSTSASSGGCIGGCNNPSECQMGSATCLDSTCGGYAPAPLGELCSIGHCDGLGNCIGSPDAGTGQGNGASCMTLIDCASACCCWTTGADGGVTNTEGTCSPSSCGLVAGHTCK